MKPPSHAHRPCSSPRSPNSFVELMNVAEPVVYGVDSLVAMQVQNYSGS